MKRKNLNQRIIYNKNNNFMCKSERTFFCVKTHNSNMFYSYINELILHIILARSLLKNFSTYSFNCASSGSTNQSILFLFLGKSFLLYAILMIMCCHTYRIHEQKSHNKIFSLAVLNHTLKTKKEIN